VLDTGDGHPAFNMALDEVLLRRDGPPTLRLYGWSPPGLSLGWFQPAEPFLALPGPHFVVRRRTGGGAIYHGDEITFAITIAAVLLPAAVAASYVLLHRAVQRALSAVGVETELVPGPGTPCGRVRAGWCFETPGPHDVVLRANGRKVVGSAQRRIGGPSGRVLHHGSIVLRAPAATPFCGAVADVVDAGLVATDLRRALAAELAAALGLAPAPGEATAEELAAAEAARSAFLSSTPPASSRDAKKRGAWKAVSRKP